MAFRNLTNSGKEYLATRLANELPVKFTKAKIGNGSIPLSTNPAQTTELYGFKKQVTILKTVQEQNSIKLTIQITNDGVNEGFYLKEIGIYVDDNGKEVLYWYCNEDNSQYINAQTDTPLSFEVDIMMEVTNVDSVVVEWSGKDTWVNKALLKEEMAKKLDKGAVSSEYDTAAKMEAKIKVAQQTATNAGSTANNKLTKGSLPAGITDAKGIYDLIENNSGLNFDPNLLFLNDAGTKTQDKIYFDRNKKGLFRCTQTTTATTNSTAYFEDISNKSSADRLANLWKIISIPLNSSTLQIKTVITTDIEYPAGYELICAYITLSNGRANLNTHNSYVDDTASIVIGKSPDGYIQYSVFNVSNPSNSHRAYFIFMKNN